MSDYILSSSDDEDSSDESEDKVGLTHVKEGYIYFFRCAGGLYKVGNTKRDVVHRLNEHKRKQNPAHRPKQDEIIQVFACDDVWQAETKILRIARATRVEVAGAVTEYLRTNIESVIKGVVAEVNSQQESQLKISYYKLDAGNKIVRVNKFGKII